MSSTSRYGAGERGSFGPAPGTMAEAEARIRDLEVALASRHIIGMAQGILMERHRLAPESAFDELRRVSQNTNVRLVSVAVRLVETGAIAQEAEPRRMKVDRGGGRRLRLVE